MSTIYMNLFKPPVSNFPYLDDPNDDLCDQLSADHDVSSID